MSAEKRLGEISFALISLVFIYASAVRFYGLDRLGLWSDELWAITANHDFSFMEMLRFVFHHENHPPGYYVLQRVNVWLLGSSDFAIRFPSAIAGIALVCTVFAIGRRHFNQQAGIIAAALLAVSNYSIYYSQEARANIFLALFAVLSIHYFIIVINQQGKTRDYWLFCLCAGLLCYLHYSGLIFVFCLGLFWLLLLIGQRSRELFIEGLKLFIPVFILLAPWIPGTWHHICCGPVESWQVKPTIQTLLDSYQAFFGTEKISVALYIAGIIFALTQLIRKLTHGANDKRSTEYNFIFIACLLFMIFAPVMTFYIKSVISQPAYNDRHFLYAIPLAALLCGHFLSSLFVTKNPRTRENLLVILVLSILVYQHHINIKSKLFTSPHRKEQYREAVNYLANDVEFLYTPGSILISNSPFFNHYIRQYSDDVKVHYYYDRTEKMSEMQEFFKDNTVRQFYMLEITGAEGINSDLFLSLIDNFYPDCRSALYNTQVAKFSLQPTSFSSWEELPECGVL